MTVIASLCCSQGGIDCIELLPAWIRDDSSPVVLAADDARVQVIANYLQRISSEQGLAARFEVTDGVVRVMA